MGTMDLKQTLRMTQQLVMTPQLQQAIKLLQLSRMELAELVQNEMMENPILEDQNEIAQEVMSDQAGPQEIPEFTEQATVAAVDAPLAPEATQNGEDKTPEIDWA